MSLLLDLYPYHFPTEEPQSQSSAYITIQHQLEIIPGNKILIPGCEPTSALSSPSLSYNLSEFGCGDALLDVDVALSAISGSYIKLGNNYNRGNTRQKWYVLPPLDVNCPCQTYDDYYNILKSLADENIDTSTDMNDYCGMNDMGYCPSPDFNDTLPPEVDPYKEEGTFPSEMGILPPVPPWGRSGT